MKIMANGKIVLLISALIIMLFFPIHDAKAADTDPPQISNCTQQKSVVEPLGDHIFDSNKGHNYLSGEFYDAGGLDYVYVLCDIGDGNGFVPMKTYTIDDFCNATLANSWATPDDMREKVSVQQYPDEWILMYGDEASDQAFHRMNSTDHIHFYNDTITLNEADHDQDIGLISINGTLYAFEEDGDLSAIGIHSSNDRGITWTALKKTWNAFSVRPQSPNPFIWNDVLYVTGESWTDTNGNKGYILISDGIDPINYTGYDYIIDIYNDTDSGYSDVISHHTAIKGIWIDKDDVAWGVLRGQATNGTWGSWLVQSNNTGQYPTYPWTEWRWMNEDILDIERTFNDFILFGNRGDNITDYTVNGSIEKHYFGGATSGNWTYEFYEPTLPSGTTVRWKFAVVDTAGNINYSETYNFTIGESSSTSANDTESFGYFYRIVYTAPSPPPTTASDTESFGYFYRIIYSNATDNGSGFIISHPHNYFYIAVTLAVFFPIFGFVMYKWRAK